MLYGSPMKDVPITIKLNLKVYAYELFCKGELRWPGNVILLIIDLSSSWKENLGHLFLTNICTHLIHTNIPLFLTHNVVVAHRQQEQRLSETTGNKTNNIWDFLWIVQNALWVVTNNQDLGLFCADSWVHCPGGSHIDMICV